MLGSKKLFEMINQEFKAQGTKYQVLNFGICCRELGGLKVTSFHACGIDVSILFESLVVNRTCILTQS